MFILLTLVFLSIIYVLLKYFSVKYSLSITFAIGLIISVISTISLWLNYKASFGEQDGIAISNKISYWLITDNYSWSQQLFMDYFIYALVTTILLFVFMVSPYIINKRRKFQNV